MAAVQVKSPCYLCAKMRRGALYKLAQELGCNKIALGHHYDDVIETTLMNMLNSGSFQTMVPKLHSDNYEGMELIRPLYYIREKDILRWMRYNELDFIKCACKFTDRIDIEKTCDSGSKRQDTKMLIKQLLEYNPLVEKNIFKSTFNVNCDKVLGYITIIDEIKENSKYTIDLFKKHNIKYNEDFRIYKKLGLIHCQVDDWRGPVEVDGFPVLTIKSATLLLIESCAFDHYLLEEKEKREEAS